LSAAHTLALVYYHQGRHGDAEIAYERVIEERKKTLGAADDDTLSSMNDLASVYEEQGRAAEAEELLKAVSAVL
jgi:tetratricopeptide (TPR) repeat protein